MPNLQAYLDLPSSCKIYIYVIEVINNIPLVYNLNQCKKMNIVWGFHFANIPLLYGDINTWQNNVLKHSFCNLLISLFLFFLAYVNKIYYVCYDMLIDNDYFFLSWQILFHFFKLPKY